MEDIHVLISGSDLLYASLPVGFLARRSRPIDALFCALRHRYLEPPSQLTLPLLSYESPTLTRHDCKSDTHTRCHELHEVIEGAKEDTTPAQAKDHAVYTTRKFLKLALHSDFHSIASALGHWGRCSFFSAYLFISSLPVILLYVLLLCFSLFLPKHGMGYDTKARYVWEELCFYSC